MRAICTLLLLVGGQLSLAVDLTAQTTVLDQQPTHTSSGNSELDCDGCGSLVVAEDFVLTTTQSLAEVTLWGGYENDQVYTDAFKVEVIADDMGSPSASPLFARVGMTAQRVATGQTFGFSGSTVNEYRFTLRFSDPPLLAPGVYWIAIANDSTGQTGDFVWAFGSLDSVNGRSGSAVSSSGSGSTWFTNVTDWALLVPSTVFVDGFESGNTSAWSSSMP